VARYEPYPSKSWPANDHTFKARKRRPLQGAISQFNVAPGAAFYVTFCDPTWIVLVSWLQYRHLHFGVGLWKIAGMTKTAHPLLGLGILAAMVSGFSCGGSDGGTCSMANACGGDIVGDWKITSSCLKVTGTLDDADCPTASINASLHATGTASYRADLTYSLAFVLSGMETIGFPATCLTFNGVTVTCDQLNQQFVTNPPAGIAALHCTSAGSGGCNCTATLPDQTDTEVGTYITGSGILTTTQTGSTPDPGGGYCVQGNTLDLTPPASMAQAGVTMSGDLTLTRQ
jgi:hypothetical protein